MAISLRKVDRKCDSDVTNHSDPADYVRDGRGESGGGQSVGPVVETAGNGIPRRNFSQ